MNNQSPSKQSDLCLYFVASADFLNSVPNVLLLFCAYLRHCLSPMLTYSLYPTHPCDVRYVAFLWARHDVIILMSVLRLMQDAKQKSLRRYADQPLLVDAGLAPWFVCFDMLHCHFI